MINKYAGKAYREDFLEYINKQYPEFFDDNEDQAYILKTVNEQSDADIEAFIKENCGEYEMPCLTYEVSAPDL